jgi:hypothetical protein
MRQAEERKHRRFTITIWQTMRIIFVIGCVLGLMAALVRLGAQNRDVPPRAACANNLKQIALALHNYHAVFNVFPPAYVADKEGRPMHSWRVLLLPFLEKQALYDRYDFNERWDGPNNIKLLDEMPYEFRCHRNRATHPALTTWTSYVAMGGPGTIFPGAKSMRLDQVTDGTADTIMVAEVANVRIPWTKPEDLDLRTMGLHINDRASASISSNHPEGANVARVDTNCQFIRESMNAIQLRSHATIAGRETADPDWD